MDNLAEELINTSISFVDDSNTLAHLARTSKKLHRIVEPHLYNSVSTNNRRKDDLSQTRMFKLLRTLRRNPQLIPYVKKLAVEITGSWGRRVLRNPLAKDKCDLHDLLQACCKSSRLEQLYFDAEQ
ncbi:hypothetical protein K458DRAFT_117558 [Lentithecium fluviatile CBS 122367]|uniref:F-box domain-containing protein n=1 Tax=Lentithecium fluviatile CBS 122367 TaxID=1168545 RepID=A0A6G1IM17_9PLEO|nr:hypothetical protein K458DRAFT_117558 [Lentithecium fluviatile CBS 122367]